jgi:hypothetical protein
MDSSPSVLGFSTTIAVWRDDHTHHRSYKILKYRLDALEVRRRRRRRRRGQMTVVVSM